MFAIAAVAAAFRATEHQGLINALFLGLLVGMVGLGSLISLYILWRSKG